MDNDEQRDYEEEAYNKWLMEGGDEEVDEVQFFIVGTDKINGDDQYQALEYFHLEDRKPGMNPHGLVIAYLGPQHYDKYATWRVCKSDRDGVWYAEVGHYFRSIVEAAENFKERCERGY